jgi:hypothetical protein
MGGPYSTHGEPRYFNLKSLDKKHLVKACSILKDNIKPDLREMKSENIDRIQLAQRVQWRTVWTRYYTWISLKTGNFLSNWIDSFEWSPLLEANSRLSSQEVSLKISFRVQNNQTLVAVLSQMNLIHNLSPSSFSVYFIVFSHLCLFLASSLSIPSQFYVHFSSLMSAFCRATDILSL